MSPWPKAMRAALVAAQRRGLTFFDAVEKSLEVRVEAFSDAKHRDQWRSTLRTYAELELGKLLVQDISVHDVLRVLNQPV